MERNPSGAASPGPYDEIQFIKYGNQDAVERALQLGEIDMVREVEAGELRAPRHPGERRDAAAAPLPPTPSSRSTSAPSSYCPDAEFNPAIQDRTVRQAIAYAVDRDQDPGDRLPRDVVRRQRDPAVLLQVVLRDARADLPVRPRPRQPDARRRRLGANDDGVREKDGETLSFDLYVRSESPYNIQTAKLIAEMTGEIGVEFNVQVVSTDKLYDLTVRTENGKPAPEFDTFIWGWGGDPYDPSFLLSILTTGEIGGSSDSFYSNPTYDRLYREQTGIFDTEERTAVIQQMVAITQRDLPYLVLTEDPELQAYRTDRIETIAPVCPDGDGRPVLRSGLLRGCAGAAARSRVPQPSTGSGNAGLAGLVGLIVGFIGGVIVTRMPTARGAASRWSCRSEAGDERALAGREGRGRVLTLIFVLIFNFFLFRAVGDPDRRSSRACRARPIRRSRSCAPTTGSTSRCSASSPTTSATPSRLDLGVSQRIARRRSGTRSRPRSRGRSCWSAPERCWRR